jgi:glutamine amidotransferase
MKIGVLNFGIGNVTSIQNMLKKVGFESDLISSPNEVSDFDKVILPGVGSFDYAMNTLNLNSWLDELNKFVLIDEKPILGICLGMQLMCKSSEEGKLPGLSWIDANLKKFSTSTNFQLKVPHMGWNNVNVKAGNSDLFIELEKNNRFYFVHSYYVEVKNKSYESSITNYNGIDFVSSFQNKNIFGVQFHPEKSHKFGLKLLENFTKL